MDLTQPQSNPVIRVLIEVPDTVSGVEVGMMAQALLVVEKWCPGGALGTHLTVTHP